MSLWRTCFTVYVTNRLDLNRNMKPLSQTWREVVHDEPKSAFVDVMGLHAQGIPTGEGSQGW